MDMQTEGTYQLVAVVGRSTRQPDLWQSEGFVHAPGDIDPVATVFAGDTFETCAVANAAGIEAARQLAMTLAPGLTSADRVAA
ncbi:hypothetical protein [Luteimonas terrae]|uniref:Uncharacterized protein n=1 Tax=Luteimonas terrae TaxID=1530191 RepID=A0A4R5U883_9GAMM|nr:hypothetical protein [Luteimonas terrae]TDK30691.1 hypothetical protein E2F49_10050 [Luteimonas terrae]